MLVYLPDARELFFSGEPPRSTALARLVDEGLEGVTCLVTPEGRADVAGRRLPLLEAVMVLAVLSNQEIDEGPASVAAWALAARVAIDHVARERVVPVVRRHDRGIEARWAAAMSAAEDVRRVVDLARFMPPAAHSIPIGRDGDRRVHDPETLLRSFLDDAIDAFIRSRRDWLDPLEAALGSAMRFKQTWAGRWHEALVGEDAVFETKGFAERSLADDLSRWVEPVRGGAERPRTCFRLELPERGSDAFRLSFQLQAPDDPSLFIGAADIWKNERARPTQIGRAFERPQESLLEGLGRAARLFEPVARSLDDARPVAVALSPEEAWSFLGDGGAALTQAGFGVMVPGELTGSGQRRLRLRLRVDDKPRSVAGMVEGAAGLGMDELVSVDWEALIGDQSLTLKELTTLAKHKSPLVKFRGAWVAVDPIELEGIRQRLTKSATGVPMRDAVRAALAEQVLFDEVTATVLASGRVARTIELLKNGADEECTAPLALNATLRPYQARGLNWLVTMSTLSLGACLADDMGLGKTIQLLAFLLHRLERSPDDGRPALLVAPTSVVGNWQREAQRFAPSLEIHPHYGVERAKSMSQIPHRPGTLVVTTYGLLRRDASLLTTIDWSVIALDEAQNIKNAASATARAARSLRGSQRFALTGTPVENRLAELWSILEFACPGFLGPLESFRQVFAIPIERYGDDLAAQRLRRLVGPFILRRLKSDPNIIQDLPPKNEMKVVCTLTKEQASLYKAVVDEELRRIDESSGIARRGRVLALLMYTKQICNHPAQYLDEAGPLARRSGKLARVTEMLEEAIASGDRALVFTQFREMGDRLVAHFGEALGCKVAFLHGGTPKKSRDAMVESFQNDPHGPRVFVLSVKAGGTGLNLTAASHVFHYDRWWNPAVEDQATDRAYRIGQSRAVQVHKLISAGTVEERIDALLESKRALAAKVVGAGEKWITELDGSALRELFALSDGVVSEDEADESDMASKPARTKKTNASRARAEGKN